MKRVISMSALAIFLSIIFCLLPSNANAEESEYRITSYITKVEFIPVPDTEKHAVGLYERRGVAVFKNGEAAAYHTRGTWDFTNSNGPFQGYTTLTFKDGSTSILKYIGTMTTDPGKLPKLKGSGEYIKGTGKYEGIKGTVNFHGGYVTPYNKETKGDVVVDVKGNYTLPK